MSALGNPVIGLLTLHMSKPSQPATTNNSIHTFDTQPTPEIFTFSSVLQGHSRHPPNHTILRSHKPLHINRLRRPSLSSIHKHPLYTCFIYIPFNFKEAPLTVNNIF